MMFSTQSTYRNRCSLLSVLSRKVLHDDDDKKKQLFTEDRYPLPELTSSGRLEVNVLNDPDPQDFQRSLEAIEPNFLYLQGYQHEDGEEIGHLVWKNVEISDPEDLCSLLGSKLPTTVYLEIPDGEEFAEALQSKGIRYVIFWKGSVSVYAAAHFRQALVSVVQSSCSHTWDAFQLAEASYRLYCAQNDDVTLSPDSENPSSLSGPQLLGDPPTIDIVHPEADAEGEEDSQESLSSVKIYDDDVTMRFLACGMPHTLDGQQFLRSLEDGINALLRIEVRGSKLHNRVSAPPPPLQAGTFSRGVVTMRCDFSTCTAAHISLLVSGNAQTCFSDQLLENHVKNELIENNRPAHALPSCEEMNPSSSFEPRKSAAIACGASVFEVFMKLPAWASQILKQLAPDVTYRSLVALGIGSIQGLPVASFDKDDATRLLFLSARQGGIVRAGSHNSNNAISTTPPSWLKPPPPTGQKRSEELCEESKPLTAKKQRTMMHCAAMRPIPHVRSHRRMLPFSVLSEIERHEAGSVRPNLSIVSVKQSISGTPPMRKSSNSNHSSSLHAQQMIALNPLPLKKHGCSRSPIQNCSEEEFLRDVMEFLILRGHTRLVPQGGLPEFPDAVLNAKRLDLFNLYREVVTRGGFNVGNGINWKGQVFSRMRNYTLTNRMTGVGNTLKRHYETYLLEYELAHDDVGGECCLLCHSSAAGDWVNCGICDEWAHFGCDRRQGLGAFKDYAKTDGLEYICPNCSTSNFRKKSQKAKNGY